MTQTQQFKLPDLAEGVVEGELVSWLVKEGQEVESDQPLLEIMTDKATVEVPSPWKGRVKKLHFKEGDTVPVGALLVEIDEEGSGTRGSASAPASPNPTPPSPNPTPPANVATPSGNGGTASAPPRASAAPSASSGRVLATPATRKLARELGVDVSSISGSGPRGRITRSDVESFARTGASPSPVAATVSAAPPSRPAVAASPASMAADERIPIRGLRKKIAEKMVQSAFTAPHFTYVEEVDMTELVRVREGLKAEAEKRGVKLTYLPFVIKALILAFRKYPHLNAHMDDAKQELVVRGSCNIGIATATDSGLIVPVVKGCERRSMLSIASEITRISAAAREGKSVLEDLQGSSFTITNLGPMGGLMATPIINYPEVAILGIHKMRRVPMLLDDETMVARDVMNVSLSFDHRVIDGHVGALFTQEIKKSLENPGLLYLDLV